MNTNSVEGFFSVFKEGMRGGYQQCSEKHLSRYVDEFAVRHNARVKLCFNDSDRAELIAKKAVGKRLTYRRTDSAQLSL